MFRWIVGKHGDLVPLLAFVAVVGAVYIYDRARDDQASIARREREGFAERRATFLADRLGTAIGTRLGAMTSGELRFTAVEDSVSRRTLAAALDTVTRGFAGLIAISAVYPNGYIAAGPNALLGREGMQPQVDTAVGNAFRRAERSRQPAATGVVRSDETRRIVIFHPVIRNQTLVGYLAAELDPVVLYRDVVAEPGVADSLASTYHSVYGPNATPIQIQTGIPRQWPSVDAPVKVADTEWRVSIHYPPVDLRVYRTERLARWVIGLVVASSVAFLLFFLRRTISRQREEITLRQAAEEAARSSAAEARERAREARELAAQLESAHRASQRLSTSLNPDDVVELFLGAVAEILDADVASLYTFEEEGEVVVGRRRIVFRNVGPSTARLQHDDIRNVRAPVAMLPTIAEAVSSGKPYVDTGEATEHGRPIPIVAGATEAAATSVTIPLQIAGHMVGVATWEIYRERREISRAMTVFAEALAAPAAAALRTAELFATLQEERMRAGREALRFAAVLDQMADGVIVVDENGKVERSNRTAVELLGPEIETVPMEEWAARFGITSVEGRPLLPTEFPLTRALRGERVRRATIIVRSSWGTERFLSTSAGPIVTSGGEEKGAAIVLRDVSDEHQYAEMLRHTNRELRRQAEAMEQVNQQLREATKAKDQFLAVMSHELRTPINAIMGYSDLLDLGVKGDLNSEQRSMINRVRDTSRHLLGLINEVLDLAKIGAGRVDLVMAQLQLREVIERAVQQVLPLANAKSLQLKVELPGQDQVLVVADETRLTQIIINLLSNAVKFTQTGGVSVRYGLRDEQVEIRVRDSGPGIPEDKRERIFEEFYQVEGGLARSSGGTGLGLAIARRFARLMGGDIRVESELDVGSEFIVTLPSVRAHSPVPEQSANVVFLARSHRLLEQVSEKISSNLRFNGTVDPTMAAALTRREAPDLVVLDACAPDFAAWRALTALQPDGMVSGTRIALVAQERESLNAVPIGEFSVLTKPIFLERAADAIQTHLAGQENSLVLIADDDPHIRQILAEALTSAGCRVTVTGDGGEALRLVSMRRPALLVLSLTLRGGKGLTALASLHANPVLRAIPIVMLVPRELTNVEMQELNDTSSELTRSGELASRPLMEIFRAGLMLEPSRASAFAASGS